MLRRRLTEGLAWDGREDFLEEASIRSPPESGPRRGKGMESSELGWKDPCFQTPGRRPVLSGPPHHQEALGPCRLLRELPGPPLGLPGCGGRENGGWRRRKGSESVAWSGGC